MIVQDSDLIKRISSSIDHTVLKPQATENDILLLCQEAVEYNFASVCINPYYVPLAVDILRSTSIPVCTVIGFPLGASASRVKLYEAEQAINDGAAELDIVANITLMNTRNMLAVKELDKISQLAHLHNVLVKVIIETCLLTNDEKVLACKIVADSGADFIKTSTGFSTGGASIDDIILLRKHSPASVRVKASGGIRSASFAIALLDVGADRLGTSSGVNIVKELMYANQ